MKFKYYLIILVVLVVLCLYNIFLYSYINNDIKNNTDNVVSAYLNGICNCNAKYEYIGSTSSNDGSINVFIKLNNNNFVKYYRFIFTPNNNYKLIDISNDIPAYIK